MNGTVVRPLLPRRDDPALQVEEPPSSRWQSALRLLQVNNLSRTHRGVVHAAEKGVQVRASTGQSPDRSKQAAHLCRIGHAVRIDFVGNFRRRPPQAAQRVLGEVPTFHGNPEHLVDGSSLALHGLRCSGCPIDLAAQSVESPAQHIGLRQLAHGQRMALQPIQCRLPLLGRILLPGFLVESP